MACGVYLEVGVVRHGLAGMMSPCPAVRPTIGGPGCGERRNEASAMAAVGMEAGDHRAATIYKLQKDSKHERKN